MGEQEAVILREGAVKVKEGKRWKNRWAVLSRLSPVADQCKIEFKKQLRNEKKVSKKSDKIKSSYCLENYVGVIVAPEVDNIQNVMVIVLMKQLIILAFSSKYAMREWEVKVRQVFGEEDQFMVHVPHKPFKKKPANDNNRTKHGTPACLCLHQNRFALATYQPPKIIGVWDLKLVTQYGVSPDGGGFIFEYPEKGKKCLFLLAASNAEAILNAFDIVTGADTEFTRSRFGNHNRHFGPGNNVGSANNSIGGLSAAHLAQRPSDHLSSNGFHNWSPNITCAPQLSSPSVSGRKAHKDHYEPLPSCSDDLPPESNSPHNTQSSPSRQYTSYINHPPTYKPSSIAPPRRPSHSGVPADNEFPDPPSPIASGGGNSLGVPRSERAGSCSSRKKSVPSSSCSLSSSDLRLRSKLLSSWTKCSCGENLFASIPNLPRNSCTKNRCKETMKAVARGRFGSDKNIYYIESYETDFEQALEQCGFFIDDFFAQTESNPQDYDLNLIEAYRKSMRETRHRRAAGGAAAVNPVHHAAAAPRDSVDGGGAGTVTGESSASSSKESTPLHRPSFPPPADPNHIYINIHYPEDHRPLSEPSASSPGADDPEDHHYSLIEKFNKPQTPQRTSVMSTSTPRNNYQRINDAKLSKAPLDHLSPNPFARPFPSSTSENGHGISRDPSPDPDALSQNLSDSRDEVFLDDHEMPPPPPMEVEARVSNRTSSNACYEDVVDDSSQERIRKKSCSKTMDRPRNGKDYGMPRMMARSASTYSRYSNINCASPERRHSTKHEYVNVEFIENVPHVKSSESVLQSRFDKKYSTDSSHKSSTSNSPHGSFSPLRGSASSFNHRVSTGSSNTRFPGYENVTPPSTTRPSVKPSPPERLDNVYHPVSYAPRKSHERLDSKHAQPRPNSAQKPLNYIELAPASASISPSKGREKPLKKRSDPVKPTMQYCSIDMESTKALHKSFEEHLKNRKDTYNRNHRQVSTSTNLSAVVGGGGRTHDNRHGSNSSAGSGNSLTKYGMR